MQRVNSTSKNMTSINQRANPAVPSLNNPSKPVNFKLIPNLNNFLKTITIMELEARAIKGYTLKKFVLGGKRSSDIYLVLFYRIGKTRYTIKSCRCIKIGSMVTVKEGSIVITKGLFNTREFKLQELPTNIVTSINENIRKFNEEYGKTLINLKAKVKIKSDKKKSNFFKGLDI